MLAPGVFHQPLTFSDLLSGRAIGYAGRQVSQTPGSEVLLWQVAKRGLLVEAGERHVSSSMTKPTLAVLHQCVCKHYCHHILIPDETAVIYCLG